MNTRKILIGSGVAAAVLTGAVFAWSTVWPTAPSYAAGVVARQVHFGGHGGWRHGDSPSWIGRCAWLGPRLLCRGDGPSRSGRCDWLGSRLLFRGDFSLQAQDVFQRWSIHQAQLNKDLAEILLGCYVGLMFGCLGQLLHRHELAGDGHAAEEVWGRNHVMSPVSNVVRYIGNISFLTMGSLVGGNNEVKARRLPCRRSR